MLGAMLDISDVSVVLGHEEGAALCEIDRVNEVGYLARTPRVSGVDARNRQRQDPTTSTPLRGIVVTVRNRGPTND